MTLGIMQPYFFPYLGYFQLIDAVDTYVNLDHVSFMKRSYMTRNYLKDWVKINVQVNGSSQNKSCREILVNFEHDYVNKFYKTLKNLYSKSPYFNQVIEEIILPNFIERETSISDFNLSIIKSVCQKLDINNNKILDTSNNFEGKVLKKEHGLQSITHQLGGSIYINAIGGTKLYNKENFKNSGIDLYFIKSNQLDLENPYLSILHQMMVYPTEHLSEQIKKYEII
jgi:hypothetical protein